jgi:hypothetical protein
MLVTLLLGDDVVSEDAELHLLPVELRLLAEELRGRICRVG